MARDRAPLPLNTIWLDEEFRKESRVNLPLVVFCLLALLCLAGLVWTLRQ